MIKFFWSNKSSPLLRCTFFRNFLINFSILRPSIFLELKFALCQRFLLSRCICDSPRVLNRNLRPFWTSCTPKFFPRRYNFNPPDFIRAKKSSSEHAQRQSWTISKTWSFWFVDLFRWVFLRRSCSDSLIVRLGLRDFWFSKTIELDKSG